MPTTIYHDPGNTESGEDVFAWVSLDKDGREGIVAIIDSQFGPMPLCTLGKEILIRRKDLVVRASEETGKHIRLCRYKRVEILDEVGK